MALNAWQKISRVIPGKPFGDGSDGAYSSATIPTMTKQSCSGAADQTDLVIAGAAFSDNDVILIIQMRGTGVGQWEVNKIASGGGTTTLVMQQNLHYTYTDSGNSQAQVTKIPQYTDVTVQAGTWTLTDWAGNVGGILTFACNGTLTPTGTISLNAKGFRGGAGTASGDEVIAYQGEGTVAASARSISANGNGGGGAKKDGLTGPAACGGSNGSQGTNGTGGATGRGATAGNANLTNIVFGGAGGGARQWESGSAGSGEMVLVWL